MTTEFEALAKIDDIPAFLVPAEGEKIDQVESGFLEDESGLVALPRLKILNALSSEVQDGDEKSGDYYCNTLNRSLGSSITVCPIMIDIEWVKFNDDMKVEWRTTDPNDPKLMDDEDSWKYKSYNMLLLLETDSDGVDISRLENGAPNICMYTARSTGTVEMKEMYQCAKRIFNAKGIKLYGQRYRLGTFKKTNKNGKKHFAFKFDFLGVQEDQQIYEMLAQIRKGFVGRETTVDYDGDRVHEQADDYEDAFKG